MALTPSLGQQPDENPCTGTSAVQADRVILLVLDDGEQCQRREVSCLWASRLVANSRGKKKE